MTAAVDLFAGPGGWDMGARRLSLPTVGIERDPATCRTRTAAGLATIEGDVRHFEPTDFPVAGLIASPPCQTFSQAGRGAARANLDVVVAAVWALGWGNDLGQAIRRRDDIWADERTGLILEPLRWALIAAEMGQHYQWIALEQVPTVLPVWQAMATVLARIGYSSVAGIVHAEQHGVPQTRKRAVLIASLTGDVTLPAPTHSLFHLRTPSRLDDGVARWVTMADVLGRPSGWYFVPSNLRQQSTIRHADQPAPTLAFGWERPRWLTAAQLGAAYAVTGDEPPGGPAPTIASRELVAKAAGGKSRNVGSRVRPWEAGVLQSFPADHPWQGGIRSVYSQIGNAMPPLLASAVLARALAAQVEVAA